MTENKGVYVYQHPSSPYFSRTCSKSFGIGTYLAGDYEKIVRTQDTGCQVNVRRDLVCTCRMATAKYHQYHKARYFNPIPKHIYAYHGVQSNTNIGAGSVKALNRRRTQRVHLLETEDRGTGSADLSAYIIRRTLNGTVGYYGSKKTSSKCVGGDILVPDGIVDEKLSPIIKCCNAVTGSEMLPPSEYQNEDKDMNNTAEYKHVVLTTPPIDIETNETFDDLSDHKDNAADVELMPKDRSSVIKPSSNADIASKAAADSKLSSDSLIQHINNLELSSNSKLSQMLADPMENKLEREYRQMFESKTKQQVCKSKTTQRVFESKKKSSQSSHEKPVHKSTSLLRKRFEALRRGRKKEETKKEVVVRPSPNSIASRKDVSVTSDPPSLEARSYTTKQCTLSNPVPCKKLNNVKRDSNPPMEDDENSYNQGVLSMFRLWSKKINLEEKKSTTVELLPKAQTAQKNKEHFSKDGKKSEGKKFFFFNRRDKNKTKCDKTPRKNKKKVLANRSKVTDALAHKTPENVCSHKHKVPTNKQEVITAKYEEMFCKAWLNKFITNSSESKDSAKIRWNNNTYSTSSSTVFELMDNVYKEAGIVRRSKSDASTTHNPNRFTAKKINFLQQNIEAWMVPKTIRCSPKTIPINTNSPPSKYDSNNVEVEISKNKWSIDTARTFSRRIELVLHSNNIIKLNNKVSSDFLKIDIPKGFFSDSTNSEEHRYRISDEEVFKIVEYETLKSKSDIRKTPNCDTGDHALNEISLTVNVKDSKNNESKVLETVIKRPPAQRDVVIQGSRVFFPKRCDVIGVGIITQMKPILKMQEDFFEDDSEPKTFSPKKKCEFAESYLQEYYRQWMPLGIDLYSSCRSNTRLKCSSEKNFVIPLSQGDGSKSCPNIHDEYRTSATLSSSDTTSDSPPCTHFDDEPNSNIFYGKVTKTKDQQRDPKISKNMRMWPKDSTEVFKKRKIYACSNKSKWRDMTEADDSCCSKGQRASDMCSDHTSYAEKKPCCTSATPKKGRCSEKRVSLPDNDFCEPYRDNNNTGILAYKGAACETCRTDVKCSKHSKVDPDPCEIQLHEPPCEFDTPHKKVPPCHQSQQNQTCASATLSGKSPECVENISPCLKRIICEESPPRRYQEIIVTKKPCPEHSSHRRPSPCASQSNQSHSPCAPIARASFAPVLNTERSEPCMRQRECPEPFSSPPQPSLKFKVRSSTANAKHSCPPSNTICSPGTTEPTEKKKKKPEKQVTCDCPPSFSECGKCKTPPCTTLDQVYPWPTNNKVSVPPSPEYSKVDNSKKCPIPDEPLPPKAEKECKPDCANRKKLYRYVDSGQSHRSSCPSSDQAYCSPPARNTCPASSHAAPPRCRGIPTPCPSNPAPSHCPNCPPKCPPPAQTHCPDGHSNPTLFYQSNLTGYPSDTALPSSLSTPPVSFSISPSPPQELLPNQNQPQPLPTSQPPQSPLAPSETPGPPIYCPKTCKNYKYKLAGLFQKINTAMKKTCVDDSIAWSNEQKVARTDINHECSHLNVKVTRSSNTDKNINTEHPHEDESAFSKKTKTEHLSEKASVLESMYDASSICHRVSTPAVNKSSREDVACTHSKTSVQSIANVVEIDFTIKITQGDKLTNIEFDNDAKTKNVKNTKVTKTCSKEIYIFHQKESSGQVEVKNPDDVNVHVIIKNFKRKNKKKTCEKLLTDQSNDQNLNKKVPNKSHTVSTEYSEISRCNVNQTGTETSNIFSVHRATWDLTSSDDKTKTRSKSSEELSDTTNQEPVAMPSQSVATITETNPKSKIALDEKSSGSERVSESRTDVDKLDEIESNTGDTDQDTSEESLTNSNEDISSDSSKPSSKLSFWRGRTKAEKIRMLKIAIDKAGKMGHEDKTKLIIMSNMLSAIMKSDSTDVVNMNVTCKDLLKDLHSSLQTHKIIKDANSMNNFYGSSTVLDEKDIHVVKYDCTKELSGDSNESTGSLVGCADSGCLCSTLAKLNVSGKGGWCCCRKPFKINIETNCDIRTSEDIFLLDYKTPILVDQATQRSRFMFSRANSFNVSIHNYAYESYVFRNSISGKELEPKKESEEIDNESSNMSSSDESPEAMAEDSEKGQLSRETVLKISDENKLILACLEPNKNCIKTNPKYGKESKHLDLGFVTAAEVLQCYETKKAVLEIYAEKTVSDGREHLVAKLPKFARQKEKEISEYGEITVNRLQKEALSCR